MASGDKDAHQEIGIYATGLNRAWADPLLLCEAAFRCEARATSLEGIGPKPLS